MTTTTGWMLTAGDYSDYHVVAMISEAQAEQMSPLLPEEAGYTRRSIEAVTVLDPNVEAYPVTVAECRWSIPWDGIERDDRSYGAPSDRDVAYVRIPGIDQPDPECQVETTNVMFEFAPSSSCRMPGVALYVHGTDLVRVRKVFSEVRAEIVADPLIATITACRLLAPPGKSVWNEPSRIAILNDSCNAGLREAVDIIRQKEHQA